MATPAALPVLCRARGEADGTSRLNEADAADVPAFCCLHLGADKITAGLRHITLDQCAGIEAKAV
jgi:hypothetical protein